MKKVLPVVLGIGAVVVSCFGLFGCSALPTDADSVTITLTSSAVDTITAGTGEVTKSVGGSISTNKTISTVTASIVDSNGAALDATNGNLIKYSMATVPTGKDKLDLAGTGTDNASLALTIHVVSSAAYNGKYTLKISATAGSATTSKDVIFVVKNGTNHTAGTPAVISALLDVGANGNATLGSSIDLDIPAVYLSAAAATHVADLDLCYSHNGTLNTDKLFSPAQAKASGFTYAANWTAPNATEFYKTTLTAAQFNAITTNEAIVALWTATSAQTASLDCAAGDVFIAKTNLNATVLVLISTQVAGAAGSISIKVAK
jgi:hypothetical protein